MPEGQSRAEGEQAGSRAEQGPERRGNISVSQSQIPRRPLRQRASPWHSQPPHGSPRTQSQVIRKGGQHLARQERQWEEQWQEGGESYQVSSSFWLQHGSYGRGAPGRP